tara:strand:- start:623 stop:1357 length:735 start_codon:yes stop_codon:yes gene_type:complete
MAYAGMGGIGGGPDAAQMGGGSISGNVDGGSGGMNMTGPASSPDVDPDVEAAISNAIGANMDMTGPASQVDVQFDPSANPPGIGYDTPNQPAPTQPGGLGPNPIMGLQMEARDFRGKISSFLDDVKSKPANQQEREVQAFLDNPRNQMNLRNLSIDYANNIDDEMGFAKYAPGVGILSGMRTMTMKGLRAMGLEPGINTPEMDALESLASRLGVSIDSRSGGIAEMPGYRFDEETGTYKKITEL